MSEALEAALIASSQLVPRSNLTRWHNDPVRFARECIRWPVIDGHQTEITDYQAQAMSDLAARGRVAVRAPRGAGKTATNAILVLWFALTRDQAGIDWKCLTTAGAWFHLEKALWPEIRLWSRRIRWDVIGREPFVPGEEMQQRLLRLRHGEAFAGATDDPHLIEGVHASSVFLILDEAKAITAATFDAVEGTLSGTGEAFALTSSTPAAPSGRFYEICTQQRGLSDWHPMHISLDMAIKAGTISQHWADQRKLQWGEFSSAYQNYVLGEFATQDEESVIPLAWLEAAMARWNLWRTSEQPAFGRLVLGVDVARGGEDKTAIAIRRGDVVEELRRYTRTNDSTETMGWVVAAMTTKGLPDSNAVAIIDSVGVGGPVVDVVRKAGCQVIAFNAGSASVRRDRSGSFGFVNQRSEAWWHLRELLDPRPIPDPNNPEAKISSCRICLPDDPELLGDLCTPKWVLTHQGRVSVEEKSEIRKRLHRSTDLGDAVVQSFLISGNSTAADYNQAAVWREGKALDPRGLRTAVRYNPGGHEFPGQAARYTRGPYGE